MSRKNNKKRRKARKERQIRKEAEAQEWVRTTRGIKGKNFFGKARRGDAAEIQLTFGGDLHLYDKDSGEIDR